MMNSSKNSLNHIKSLGNREVKTKEGFKNKKKNLKSKNEF